MATRCTIEVQGQPVKLYKHWDGYPDAIVPQLMQAIAIFEQQRSSVANESGMFIAWLPVWFRSCDKQAYDDPKSYRMFTGRADTMGAQYCYKINKQSKITWKEI